MDTMGSDARGLAADLLRLLQCNDSAAYGAYEQLGSRWYMFALSGAPRIELAIAHGQSDAYAASSGMVVKCTRGKLSELNSLAGMAKRQARSVLAEPRERVAIYGWRIRARGF
ncbi:hypothetical protein FVE85_1181 [Porphyridium purpureum]|uniref:Uncharacterized protein n=1 Tax=Porphyridium purpureum TaxID=35688 RepID=A0A5J4Z2S2_PORPP|nr:hypothetical protein FVE85_1181 [Porphyridium purpureum]|eukprot:POR3428..scf208_2